VSLQQESSPAYWDRQADSLAEARFAVWSVDPDDYDATTTKCVDLLRQLLPFDVRSVMEVGCGIGRLTLPIAEAFPGAEVYGIDFSVRLLEYAHQESYRRRLTDRVHFVCSPAQGPLPVFALEAAYSVAVLQHVLRPTALAIIANVAHYLRPGGSLVIQTVYDREFEDEGHVPPAVVAEWFRLAGLVDVTQERGKIFPDWLWTVGRVRP